MSPVPKKILETPGRTWATKIKPTVHEKGSITGNAGTPEPVAIILGGDE